ncbi:MAG TPA: type VI secretion system baseplate subunit TssK [Bryobacteraceae bacterium]|jgi:type VI secretion system protein ImpJ|nr:type VI secretion system baseplate subunit TssK [Bryobacteraceae bacterium]
MRRLQPIVWAKGTFLSPQHLQAQDIFHEDLLQFRVDALNFFPWGFRTLTLDREALAGGNLAIDAASGIFPDGLIFDIPGSDPPPPPKPLASYFDMTHETIDVYLAVPAWRYGNVNVATSASSNADTRYMAEVELLRDENASQIERPVQIARKNFRLLVDREAREGTPAIRLARIKRTESKILQLDPEFVAPLLDIQASEYLMSILRRLIEILTSKSATLSGMRRQKSQGLADFSASDIANFWLLYTVNTYLPPIRHLLEVRRGHPEVLFNAMNALAGSLTTFSTKILPRDLPIYDHRNLGSCLGDLDDKLRYLLETVIPSNFVALPLRFTQISIYATPINDDKYLQNTKMYLAVNAEMPEGELIAKAPQLIKPCSANHLEHLVRNALPGLQMRHMPNPPTAIPVKLNYQYFSLNQSGAAWEAILRSRTFATYVPADFPNPQIELIIVMP